MSTPDPIKQALAGEAQALEAKQVGWVKANRKPLIIGAALGAVLALAVRALLHVL